MEIFIKCKKRWEHRTYKGVEGWTCKVWYDPHFEDRYVIGHDPVKGKAFGEAVKKLKMLGFTVEVKNGITRRVKKVVRSAK